jgi:hypothetical protein
MVDLLGNNLHELLELLKLRGHELQQLLQMEELLLLESLYLLDLLGDDLQQLHDLLWELLLGLRRAEAVAHRLRRIGCRCADTECCSCEWTHLTSSSAGLDSTTPRRVTKTALL